MTRRTPLAVRITSSLLALGAVASFETRAHAANFGAGLMLQAGGNFQNKPDRQPYEFDNNPGFGGLTLGGGLMLDGRVLDLLGVEADILRTTDKGGGDVTINGYKGHIVISQSAWHVPLLFKITVPSPIVAPMFFIGPEFVFPGSHDGSVDGVFGQAGVRIHSKSDNYTMLTLGGGVEIKLPLPILDLRLPIGLRFSYNPGLSDKYADRTTNSPATGEYTYSSEMKYVVALTAGAALYF